MITFIIPIRTQSEMNLREHWAKRAKRAKLHRKTAALMLGGKLHSMDGIAAKIAKEIRITITRIGKRKLDADNLAASCKHVQDGIADALKIDDGDRRMFWNYNQEIAKEYAVRVQLELTI